MGDQFYKSIKNNSFKGWIGIARADITPPVAIYSRNWGAARHDVADGVHQPLTLTGISFQSSVTEKPLVLISADLGGWKNPEDEKRLRTAIRNAVGIGESQLMFCLSHTHAGPSVSTDDTTKPGGSLIGEYLNRIEQMAINLVKQAIATACPAILSWQYGKCSLAANRDLPEAGTDRILVGYNPGKVADDTVLVGRITNDQEVIIGTIVNYACHPTTLAFDNRFLSPDYIGSMRGIVESATQAPCLFLQGASGEMAPAKQYSGDTAVAEKNGRQLGYAVMSTLESMLGPGKQLSFSGVIESGAALAGWTETKYEPSGKIAIRMPDIPFPLKPLPSLTEIELQYEQSNDRVTKERLFRKRGVRKAVGNGDIAHTPVWIWQLGESFLIGQPNECYSEFQQQLRRQFPAASIAVMNLVNGGIGYLPPANLYSENLYPAWQTPFAAGSLELLTGVTIDTISAIKNEK